MPCFISFVNRHVPGDPSVPGSPPTQADWDIIADHIVTIDRDPELYAQFFKHTNALNEAPEREKYDDDTSFEVSFFFCLFSYCLPVLTFCFVLYSSGWITPTSRFRRLIGRWRSRSGRARVRRARRCGACVICSGPSWTSGTRGSFGRRHQRQRRVRMRGWRRRMSRRRRNINSFLIDIR